jgi:PTH2 family peptidyl-tRNA hydrolase
VKLVLVVRGDLGMGAGKVASQCAHAALKAQRRLDEPAADAAAAAAAARLKASWRDGGEKIVVVRGESLAQLEGMLEQARRRGLRACAVTDAGRTQVEPGSLTILAVGPAPEEEVDDVTGHLRLL